MVILACSFKLQRKEVAGIYLLIAVMTHFVNNQLTGIIFQINENCYALTFGGDYGFKDGAESIILSTGGAESMMLSSCLQAQRP